MGALDTDEGEVFPPLQVNYARGVGLLYLATEQIRLFDPITADIITKDYLLPIRYWFDNALRNPDYEEILRSDADREYRWHELQAQALDNWKQEVEPKMPPTPPGLGYGTNFGFREAKPRPSFTDSSCPQRSNGMTPQAAIFRPEQAGGSPWGSSSLKKRSPVSTNVFASPLAFDHAVPVRKDYGAIGPQPKTAPEESVIHASGWWPANKMGAQDLVGSTPLQETLSYEQRSAQHDHQQQTWTTKPPMETATLRAANRSEPILSTQTPQVSADNMTVKTPEAFYDAVRRYVLENKEELLDRVKPSRIANQTYEDTFHNDPNPTTSNSSRFSPDTFQDATTRVQSPDSESGDVTATLKALDLSAAQAPTSSSWARIAALTSSGISQGETQTPVTIAISNKPAQHRRAASAASKAFPTETEAQQYRCVFIGNLPKGFTAHDVSVGIQTGAVMSILMQHDAHETLPGLSACVIFQDASSATAFLEENHYSVSQGESAGPSVYAGLSRTTRGKILDKAELKSIKLIRGGPFTLDATLMSMGPPTFCRRRVKWSRARLFYDISMKQFKKDVFSTVGGAHNVEIFHFYNPGECTVVFASVDVAATCVAQFQKWREEQLEDGNARSEKFEKGFYDQDGERRDRAYSGAAGNGGASWGERGAGDSGLKPVGHLDKCRGRYEGVEFGFVKDFNEVPSKLYSQYGKDGRLRSSSRMEGCEGLYEGPGV